jgi:6-phosphogluconolactonase
MKIEVFADADSVAREAAAIIAAEARASVAAHGRFIVAFSGGHTPWLMLRALADQTVPWAGVHVAQVDERVAPAGDPDRNLTHLRESLLEHAPLRPDANLRDACGITRPGGCSQIIRRNFGGDRRLAASIRPCPLGIGTDGHTGSLVPGDPVLQVTDRDVAVTGIYPGKAQDDVELPDSQAFPARTMGSLPGAKRLKCLSACTKAINRSHLAECVRSGLDAC